MNQEERALSSDAAASMLAPMSSRTPQAPIKVELKSRKSLRTDLDKLERVSRALATQMPALTGTVESVRKPLSLVRRSVRAPEELSVVMKGRQITINRSPESGGDEDGMDEDLYYIQNDEYVSRLRRQINTPVTSLASPRLLSAVSTIKPETKLKPAILPATGTLKTVKMLERPKPPEKYKTLNPISLKARKPARRDIKVDGPPAVNLENLSESELKQLELENEMRAMKKEAMEIGGKDIAKRFKGLDTEYTDLSGPTDKVSTKDNTSINLRNERGLLKSVEGLILAIKTGQLVKEQEQSNRRIQEILGRVLDKESLSMMDPTLNETETEAEYDPDMTVLDKDTGRNLADVTNDLSERSRTSKHTTESRPSNKAEVQSGQDLSETKESRSKKSSQVKFDDGTSSDFDAGQANRNFESLLITDDDSKTPTPAATFFSPSFDEEDLRLAMLPQRVTYKELMTVPSRQAKLNVRQVETVGKISPKKTGLTTEERFARNLHLFCMMEHERRNSILLPDELENVTRKYHTRNKYDLVNTGFERSA